MIIWRKFFLFILIIVRLVGLVLLLFCYLLSLFICCNSFLQRMRRLVGVWIFHCCMISRRFTSCSLLRHRTLISVMKWLGFLKIWNSRLLLRFFILNINVIIICVSCVHLVRHVKATEIRRNKLSTCNLRTSLLIRHYACMDLTTSILTCFHLSQSFSFFFNSRSSIVDLLLLFLVLIHRIWWLILVLLFLDFLNFSVLWLTLFNFWRSFSCLCASSLSRMTSSWFRTCSVCLQMLLNKLFNIWFSHPVKIRIS